MVLMVKAFIIDHNMMPLLYAIGLCMLYSIFIIGFNNANKEISKKIEEYEQLRFYTGLIEDLVDSSNGIKHDIGNILLTADGYLRNKDYEELKVYLSNIVSNYNNNSEISFYQLKYIKDSGIKGLLTMKLNEIATRGIQVDIEVSGSVDLAMGALDFTRIAGILIDNAYEAAIMSREKHIRIGFISFENTMTFHVSNTFDVKPEIHSIYKKGVSTKGAHRGLGLAVVRGIVDSSYPNVVINTFIKDDYFVQELVVDSR